MPVPVTPLFPPVAVPGLPVATAAPSAGEAEPGAFLAALASVGDSAQPGEGPPVMEQALPTPGRIAPQVAAQQVVFAPVAASAPRTVAETPVVPVIQTMTAVPPLVETEAPAIPLAASAPAVPLPIASPPTGPTAAPVDAPEVPALATIPAEVTTAPVDQVFAETQGPAPQLPEDVPPQPSVTPGKQPTAAPVQAAPVQKEQPAGAPAEPKVAADAAQVPLAPVTLAVAAQAEAAPPFGVTAEPEAEAAVVARPTRRKTAATVTPAPSGAAAPVAGTPFIAAAPSAPAALSDPIPATAAPEPAVTRTAAPATHAAPQPAEDTASPAPEARVSAPLFTQTLEAATTRPTALPYDTARSAPAPAPAEASVSMREGHFGSDVGVAIARALDGGPDGLRDALLIRLDPRHMGRIDVRMGFDDDGTLRAVVSADQPAALDLLRRESTHLDRALSDAGVRADAQSLRFDSSGGSFGNDGGHAGQHRPSARAQGTADDFTAAPEEAAPILRSLRGSGNLDLMA